jgi:hypothetical protein
LNAPWPFYLCALKVKSMDLISPLVDVLKFAIAAYIIYAIAKDLLKNYFELKNSKFLPFDLVQFRLFAIQI